MVCCGNDVVVFNFMGYMFLKTFCSFVFKLMFIFSWKIYNAGKNFVEHFPTIWLIYYGWNIYGDQTILRNRDNIVTNHISVKRNDNKYWRLCMKMKIDIVQNFKLQNHYLRNRKISVMNLFMLNVCWWFYSFLYSIYVIWAALG